MTARCAWPLGDPRLPGFRFCGAEVARPGLPYCAEHARLAHPPARRPTRLRKSPQSPVRPTNLRR
jgi:GcrA cell cycle regulator